MVDDFWGEASAGMSLIAGRFAYGARVSQPSYSCEYLAEEISAQWRISILLREGRRPFPSPAMAGFRVRWR